MDRIIHYFRIYQGFISTSITEAMSYRLNFILLIAMDLFFYFSSLASVSFIYDHVELIGPWNKNELLFFLSFMLVIDHLHMTFVSESFWVLSQFIRTGELDFVLLRPASSIFTTFFRFVRPSSFLNIFVTWGCLIYFGMQLNFDWIQWALIPILVILAFTLLIIIEFIVSTSMFWVTEGLSINFLRMQMQQVSRWPDFIYKNYTKRILTTFLPLLVVGSAPVTFLYDFTHWQGMAWLIVLIVIGYFILRFVWNKGLNRYDSASS